MKDSRYIGIVSAAWEAVDNVPKPIVEGDGPLETRSDSQTLYDDKQNQRRRSFGMTLVVLREAAANAALENRDVGVAPGLRH